jgi:hypothetical protein
MRRGETAGNNDKYDYGNRIGTWKQDYPYRDVAEILQ